MTNSSGTQAPRMEQLDVPLSGWPWGRLYITVPMPQQNWDELMRYMDLIRGAVTAPPEIKSAHFGVTAEDLGAIPRGPEESRQ